MRVSTNSKANGLLINLQQTARRIEELQNQLATGKRFQVPSEDPNATRDSMELRTVGTEVEQYLKNANDGAGWLETTDIALDQLGSVFSNAKDLAIYGANDSLPAESKMALAQKGRQLIAQAVQIANSTHGSRYIFAGYSTGTKPYALNADGVTVTRAAPLDAGQDITRQVGDGEQVTINVTGDTLQGTSNIFDALKGLVQDLEAGNSSSLSTTRAAEIEAAGDHILEMRARVGAKVNRMEAVQDQLQGIQINFTSLLSKAEDADIPRALIDLKVAQSAYETALAVGARIIPPTLVDFLR